jgi:hypothetical protein
MYDSLAAHTLKSKRPKLSYVLQVRKYFPRLASSIRVLFIVSRIYLDRDYVVSHGTLYFLSTTPKPPKASHDGRVGVHDYASTR